MSPQIAVVTAFSRGYDRLTDAPKAKNAEFFAFSDVSPTSIPQGWTPRILPAISLSPKRRCVFVKTHLQSLLPGFDFYLWLDARISLNVDPSEIASTYGHLLADAAAVTFRHPRNNSLADEIDEILTEGLLTPEQINDFRNSLDDDTANYVGMCETNVMLTAPTFHCRTFLRSWWTTFEASPPRDQLSVLPAIRHSQTQIEFFDEGRTDASTASFVSKGLHSVARQRRLRHQKTLRETIPARSIPSIALSAVDRTTQSLARTTKAGIVIPFHNNGEGLRRLITSLESSNESIDVLIVDNGSSAENSEICDQTAEQSRHRCEVIRTHDALGFGGAANLGVERLGLEHALLVNSDTQFPSLSLERHSSELELGNFVALGFVGNRSGDQTVVRELVERLVGDGTMFAREVIHVANAFCSSWSDRITPQTSRTIHGSAMFLDVESFLDLGGFDTEAFPIGYGEEVDLCIRAEMNGRRVGISSSLYYWHDGGGTFGSDRRRILNLEGKRVLHERYPWFPWSTVSQEIAESPLIKTLGIDLTSYLESIITEPDMSPE